MLLINNSREAFVRFFFGFINRIIRLGKGFTNLATQLTNATHFLWLNAFVNCFLLVTPLVNCILLVTPLVNWMITHFGPILCSSCKEVSHNDTALPLQLLLQPVESTTDTRSYSTTPDNILRSFYEQNLLLKWILAVIVTPQWTVLVSRSE